MKQKIGEFIQKYERTILVWIIILGFLAISISWGVEGKLIAFVVVVFGLFTQAFQGLIGLLGLIPYIGPYVGRILSLPLFWVLNGLAYLVTFFAVRFGEAKRAVGSRVITIAFLIGVVVGFIFGKTI